MMQKIKSYFSNIRLGKPAMMVVVLLGFLSGYNGMTSYTNYCSAQLTVAPGPTVTVIGGICPCCAPTPCPVPCDPSGTAQASTTVIQEAVNVALQASAYALEMFLAQAVDGMMQALLTRLNQVELNMIDWWQTMWTYNLRPSLQAMTIQLNTATADQSKSYQASMDAEHSTQNNSIVQFQEVQTHKVVRDDVCPPAGLSPSRGDQVASGMQKALQKESADIGANKTGTSGAGGPGMHLKARIDRYENNFCDPNGNGGHNICGASNPAFYNADTKLTEVIYNQLTIPFDGPDGTTYETAVKEIVENLTGSAVAVPIATTMVDSSRGQMSMLDRRSFLARHNAIRATPHAIIGERTPGTRLGQWVEEIRTGAGIPVDEIGDNPSYREVMHALAIDRFNDGKFANNMIKDEAGVEMEKLTTSAFQLMLLRDYHELLERMALSLAVQVSVMAEENITLPNIIGINNVE